MRLTIMVCGLFVLHLSLLAQDSSGVRSETPLKTSVSSEPVWQPPRYGPKPVQLSANPTVEELAQLFVEAGRGEVDPFDLVGKIAERKDEIVTTLSDLLFSEAIEVPKQSMPGDTSTATVETLMPNKVYPVWALKAIGSSAAFSTLFQSASSHREIEVRALSLHSLGLDYFHKVESEGLTPDKEIIHLFLRNLDDERESLEARGRIGDVARSGLKNWIGVEIANEKMSSTEREQWWLENKEKFVWNASKATFELQ